MIPNNYGQVLIIIYPIVISWLIISCRGGTRLHIRRIRHFNSILTPHSSTIALIACTPFQASSPQLIKLLRLIKLASLFKQSWNTLFVVNIENSLSKHGTNRKLGDLASRLHTQTYKNYQLCLSVCHFIYSAMSFIPLKGVLWVVVSCSPWPRGAAGWCPAPRAQSGPTWRSCLRPGRKTRHARRMRTPGELPAKDRRRAKKVCERWREDVVRITEKWCGESLWRDK